MFRVRHGRTLIIKKPNDEEVRKFAGKILEVHSRSKADKTKMRLMAGEMLRLLKSELSYRDLFEITGIPESVLCRYVRGSIIPSPEQASYILAKIALSIDLSHLLRDLVEKERSPIIDLLRVLKDPYVARLLSLMITLELTGKTITKVVSTAEAVLPLATMISLEFNAPVVLVKRKSYPGIQYYSTSIMKSPKEAETLYLDRDLITRKDSVLVIADVVYSGRTLEAVLELLNKSRATIADVIVVLGLGDAWRERLESYNIKVLTVIPFSI